MHGGATGYFKGKDTVFRPVAVPSFITAVSKDLLHLEGYTTEQQVAEALATYEALLRGTRNLTTRSREGAASHTLHIRIARVSLAAFKAITLPSTRKALILP